MHRYFARRPYSVFAELIRHYTRPKDVVLDPFCGGGVTLVEGVLEDRRVIGFDVNPLATFITRMELDPVELRGFAEAKDALCDGYRPRNDALFATACRRCGKNLAAEWFEYSALVNCARCGKAFAIAAAKKHGIGRWQCPNCFSLHRFSFEATTRTELVKVCYQCPSCGHRGIDDPIPEDVVRAGKLDGALGRAEADGLWLPNEAIPDCNMQRESALFKKGILHFRQLFTSRHLLALGWLKHEILRQGPAFREWLLFAFSSTLRYTNRMVMRNPGWRGERPLEWVKPGFWLPPVFLEANVLHEFGRRCDAVLRGKADFIRRLSMGPPKHCASAIQVLDSYGSAFHVTTLSAASLPLPDESIDAIITDPPYGSYVHYADLSNFWSVWLPEIPGLGGAIDATEEAVIARKNFPGAKNAIAYQRILERCFKESFRVLKPNGYMVLTFHNREPRAWVALLTAAAEAGFDLPPDGILFQEGIPSYRHTAQSRRAGSVIGDFILSVRKPRSNLQVIRRESVPEGLTSEDELVKIVHGILRTSGPLAPDALLARVYAEYYPRLLTRVRSAVRESGEASVALVQEVDRFRLFDSHRRQLLERHFRYGEGKWSLRETE